MRKSLKIALITAGVLCATGLIAAAAGGFLFHWNMEELDIVPGYEEKIFLAQSDTREVILKVASRSVRIENNSSDAVQIEYSQDDLIRYILTEEDGTVTMTQENKRHWFDSFRYGMFSGIKTSSPIVVKLPAGFAGALSVQSENGRIDAEASAFLERCRLLTSNARVAVKNLTCGELEARSSNAAIQLKNVSAEGSITANTSNASVLMTAVSCKAGAVKTSNGGLRLENVTARERVEAQTSNGSVKFTVTAPQIKLQSSNGSITGRINGRETDYSISCKTSNSSQNLYDTERPESENRLDIATSNGKVQVRFTN